jgi:Asp/Glu/hydantoin racemase
MSRLCLLHTAPSTIPVFRPLTNRFLPGVDCVNFLDETLLLDTIREGRITPFRIRRVLDWLVAAQASEADAVLVTCSSIGPAVDAVRGLLEIPVVRVDEPMAEYAVKVGKRVAVLATLSATLRPTTELIERKAAEAQRPVEITSKLCEGAFEALTAGDTGTHDRLIRTALDDCGDRFDVVVLAQASMARALPESGEGSTTPVLTSPEFGVRRIAESIGGGATV